MSAIVGKCNAVAPVRVEDSLVYGSMDLDNRLRVTGEGGTFPVVITPSTSNTASSSAQVTIGTSPLTALAANANRKGFSIQNQGTTILYILLGAGTVSNTNYTFALPACGVNNDGSSSTFLGFAGVVWTGIISWISSASGGLGTAVELT